MLCAALGCAQHARTASFKSREKIPFGPIAVSVEGWEEVGEAHAPLSSLRTEDGRKAIAVFVSWSGLEPYTEPDRQVFAEEFLRRSLQLVDSDGSDYEAVAAMPLEIYHFSSQPMAAPRDWVVVFHAKAEGRGYTLHLHHPDPGEDAFDVAVVSLG
ncbi:MAG TPA: hypothetical protein VFG76_03000 [Candidatus Polarisedimenticolia bacterium]|nr:hypothetical protein [Candidatus Polarisedimenticolia bacterium]